MDKPLRSGFVSYARDDSALVGRLLDIMRPRCAHPLARPPAPCAGSPEMRAARTRSERLAALAEDAPDGVVRVWDAAGGEGLLVIHALEGREHPAVAGGRVTSCSAGAWRRLGWLAPSPMTGALTRYPAETFGPLPVSS